MAELLTISEIETRFPDEWVLVANPQLDEDLEVCSGTVICHSKDRDEVYRAAITHPPAEFAFLYTGQLPPDTAILI